MVQANHSRWFKWLVRILAATRIMWTMDDFVWKLRTFWDGLTLPEQIVFAANALWAGFWFLIIALPELGGDGGWALILGGLAWFWGQAVLAAVGLVVSLLFGGGSTR